MQVCLWCLFVCFFCMLSIGTYTRLPAKSSNLWNRPTIPNVSVSLFRAALTIFSKHLWWECQSRLFQRPAHTQALMSAVESRHRRRNPASAAASRLTSSHVVGLRRDIVTHRSDNVRFCSLDCVPCRSHSSLPSCCRWRSFPPVSESCLFPFCRRFAVTILQFSRSSPFVGYLPLLCEPALIEVTWLTRMICEALWQKQAELGRGQY